MQNRFRISASSSRVVYLLLALVLLIGQSAAQAHVYSHLKSTTPRSDFDGAAGQLCGQCLSSASLLSSAGSHAAPLIVFVAAVVTPVTCRVISRDDSARYYGFRSRAPPELF